MKVSEEVRAQMLAKIEESLSNHTLSEKGYPKEVIIKTVYKDCTQTLIIKFDESQED